MWYKNLWVENFSKGVSGGIKGPKLWELISALQAHAFSLVDL